MSKPKSRPQPEPATQRVRRPHHNAGLLGVALILFAAASAWAGEPGAAGDLYVSGFSNNNVVQYDGVTGELVGEFVVSGGEGLDLEGATDFAFGPNGNLFLCSRDTSGVLEYDGTTGAAIHEFIPRGSPNFCDNPDSGWLCQPVSLVFTPDGRLLVMGRDNFGVQEYDTATGEWLGTFLLIDYPEEPEGDDWHNMPPWHMEIGPNGNLFVLGWASSLDSNGTGHIFEFHITTGRLERIVTDTLNAPVEFTFGPNGNLFVLNIYNEHNDGLGYIIEVDIETGENLGTFVASDPGLTWPRGLTFGPNGNLFVTTAGRVLEFDGETGDPIGQFATGELVTARDLLFKPAPPQPMSAPDLNGFSVSRASACNDLSDVIVTGTDLDPDQTLVMLTRDDEPAAYIGRVTGGSDDGTELTVDFNLDGGARMRGGWWDVTVKNPDGQSDTLPNAVRISPCRNATQSHLFTLEANDREDLGGAWGVYEYGPDTASFGGHQVGILIQDKTGGDLANSDGNLLFARDGNLLVAAGASSLPDEDSVVKFNGLTGRKIGIFIPAGSGGMYKPMALRYGPNGNLFVLHRRFLMGFPDPSGVLEFNALTGAFVSVVVPLEACGLFDAFGFEFGPNDDLYITVGGNGSIWRFDGTTGDCVGPQPFLTPPDDVDFLLPDFGADEHLYATWGVDSAYNRVKVHDPETGAELGEPIPPGLGQLLAAGVTEFGPNGHLFVHCYERHMREFEIVSLDEANFLGFSAGMGSTFHDMTFRPPRWRISSRPVLGGAAAEAIILP